MPDEAMRGAEPEALWRHFGEIARIPRCSKHEERIREFVVIFAREHGLRCRVDEAGNVAVEKKAHPGRESRPRVVLQGHLDMVCEQNRGSRHDFSADPIALVRDGDWLRSGGTTLGADNGIAVAAALAVLEDPSIEHGPLQALFTVDEESGLVGAARMDPTLVQGAYLLNLDSEDEGVFYVGCAGGQNTEGWIPVETEAAPSGVPVTIAMTGLRGGHSGTEIHLGLGNAIALGNRFAWRALQRVPLHVYDVSGGGLHNAIPRELFLKAIVRREDFAELSELARLSKRDYALELGDIEPGLDLTVTENGERPERSLTPESVRRLVDALYGLPHGVVAMSRKMPGLVETSTNLAAAHLERGELHVLTSQRAERASAREDVAAKVSAVIRAAGGRVEQAGIYSSWPADPDSELVRICRTVYRRQTGKDPVVKAVHAGLECGVIGEKVPGIQMISFGPDIAGAHTPDERVSIPSCARVWKLLLEILRSL